MTPMLYVSVIFQNKNLVCKL